MLHKRVKFRGREFWLTESEFSDALLSPIDHYSDNGELLANHLGILAMR